MATQKILVPYNFMPYDQKALDFVVNNFLSQDGAEITLFKSYAPIPDYNMQASPVMAKLKSNLSIMTTQIKEMEDGLNDVRDGLIQSGFNEDRVKIVFRAKKKKDIAAEIIALSLEQHFQLIVINHKPGKVSHFFTGNVFNKIITTLKDVTVCVIT